MCQFLSGYIDWKGNILIGDGRSHSSAEKHHNLRKALDSPRPPVPFEWVDKRIEIRVPDSVDRDESWYEAILTAEAADQYELFAECTLPASLERLDVYSCPGLTSLPTLPASLERLHVYNCPGLTVRPEVPSGCRVCWQ